MLLHMSLRLRARGLVYRPYKHHQAQGGVEPLRNSFFDFHPMNFLDIFDELYLQNVFSRCDTVLNFMTPVV